MRVKTFMGKVNLEALRHMDEQINKWMAENEVEPKTVTQSMGTEQFSDGSHEEPAVVTSLWY
jgi:hypothetical protein